MMDEMSGIQVLTSLPVKSLMTDNAVTTVDPDSRQTSRSSPTSLGAPVVQASTAKDDSRSTQTEDHTKTVSILSVAPTTKLQLPTEVAGATVFVGAGRSGSIFAASSANSTATSTPALWRRTSVPEVQTLNDHGTGQHQQEHQQQDPKQQLQANPPVLGQTHLHQQSLSQHQSLQTHQSGQHVVKIRINPEDETGRVISTIRFHPKETNDRFAPAHQDSSHGTVISDKDKVSDAGVWARRNDATRLSSSGRIIINEIKSQPDSCVRISVVSGAVTSDNIAQQRENNHNNTQQRHTSTIQSPTSCEQSRQTEEMVQQRGTTNGSVNSTSTNRTGTCFYYSSFPNSLTTMMMSSGQCSPSDTLDSGTCSDLDGTPPPLPKKKNSSTVLLGVNAGNPVIGDVKDIGSGQHERPQPQNQHNRAGSVTSSGPELDSDDNESNISCDSLNSGELVTSRMVEDSGVRVNGIAHAIVGVADKIGKAECHGTKDNKEGKCSGDIGEDNKAVISDDNGSNVKVVSGASECHSVNENNDSNDLKNNNSSNINNNNNNINANNNNYNKKIGDSMSSNGAQSTDDEEMNARNNGDSVPADVTAALPTEVILASGSSSAQRALSPNVSSSSALAATSSLSKVSSSNRVRSPVPNGNGSFVGASPMVKECTYEERSKEQSRIDEKNAADDYYANHNRKNGTKYLYDDDRFYDFHINEKQSVSDNPRDSKVEDKESDEYFAGYKILDREAIRSAKGTVRGVKNRVRAGIATFLQKPSTKNYKIKDAGKIVVYTTSMSIVRETYFSCIKMLQMLKTHMVKHEVRDLFMSRELQTELKERIGCETIEVPQLFIDGQYIGNADAVERLNESGELRRIFKPYKSPDACTTCRICGGCRLLPCDVCNGSKKSPVRNDFMKEFYWLRCMNCDEVGLIRCKHC